jgi:uncharacterized protein
LCTRQAVAAHWAKLGSVFSICDTRSIRFMAPTIQQRLNDRLVSAGSAVMYQRWTQLLFLHWKVPAERIRQKLPKGLHLDTFENEAYVGLVPFFMKGIRPRFLPAVPWLSNFLELNVRTYVFNERGETGVYFFTLDCTRWPAVQIARSIFHLPYFTAKMSAAETEDGMITYRSQSPMTKLESTFRYRIAVPSHEAEPGTLEFFLLERYNLFTVIRDKLYVGRVRHSPYPISDVSVEEYDSSYGVLRDFGIQPATPFVHAASSRGVQVKVYPLEPSR